jgi:hypothetical protein
MPEMAKGTHLAMRGIKKPGHEGGGIFRKKGQYASSAPAVCIKTDETQALKLLKRNTSPL